MVEELETSIGSFKVEWGTRFEVGSDSPAETALSLTPDCGAAGSRRRAFVGSAGEIEAVLIRAGVPIDEARSLSSDLWEHRWQAEEDRRRRDDEFREFTRLQDELKEEYGSWTELRGLSSSGAGPPSL